MCQYRYSEERCKFFDGILEDIHNAKSLYTAKNLLVDNQTNEAIRIISQGGFLIDYKETGDSLSFKISPSGAEFYRNGGFTGERQRFINTHKDRSFSKAMAIISSIVSIIGGGAAGAILSCLLK